MKVGKESRLKDSQIGQLSGTENIAVLGTEKYQKVITGP